METWNDGERFDSDQTGRRRQDQLGVGADGQRFVEDGARSALEVEHAEVLAGARVVDAAVEARTLDGVAEETGRRANNILLREMMIEVQRVACNHTHFIVISKIFRYRKAGFRLISFCTSYFFLMNC